MNMSPEIGVLERLFERLDSEIVTTLNSEELSVLVTASEEERQVQTSLAGVIRVLRFGQRRLFQEQTTEGTLVLRLLRSEDEAAVLIKDRLDTYERMWDG